MLVCNVSLRPPRLAIAAEVAEAVTAADATATGQVVFATLVDDPANVLDTLDAFLGDIMIEAATAADAPDAGIVVVSAADIAEAATAASVEDATITTMGAEAAAFLARTSGLDSTHSNAYVALIDGLVADGIWAKLDLLHIYATQDSTTAKLNLVSTSFPAVANGSPTFTADRGFTGVNDSSTVYISTGFNPTTASSPKFTRDSAHISAWTTSSTIPTNYNFPIGFNNSGATFLCCIFPKTPEGTAMYRINSANSGGYASYGSGYGHYIGVRSSSSATAGYNNGTSVVTDTPASVAVPNLEIFVLGQNNNGAAIGDGRQVTMASIGSSLTSTEATNYYNRLRTYMTAVGVP